MNLDYNKKAVCPYCGEEWEILGENYKNQDEYDIIDCDCGKKFAFQIDYDVTFSSETFEEWAEREINGIEDDIKWYEDFHECNVQRLIENNKRKIEDLKKEIKENKEEEDATKS